MEATCWRRQNYRSEAGAVANSDVETFVALCMHIDTWRWAGVPFYIRAGKYLPVTSTEVRVNLKCLQLAIFDEVSPANSNYFHFRLSPEVVISAGARVKQPATPPSTQLLFTPTPMCLSAPTPPLLSVTLLPQHRANSRGTEWIRGHNEHTKPNQRNQRYG